MAHDYVLFLNTTGSSQGHIALVNKKRVFLRHFKISHNLSEQLLSQITQTLKRHKLTLHQLSGLAVVVGPGSFTGVRVGVAMANALVYATSLKILPLISHNLPQDLRELYELNEFKKHLVKPFYSKGPDITKSNKKSLF